MPWTEPPLFVTGTKVTAAYLNTLTADLDYLKMSQMSWVERLSLSTFTVTGSTFVDWHDGVGTLLSATYLKRESDTDLHCFVYTGFRGNSDSVLRMAIRDVGSGVDFDMQPPCVISSGSDRKSIMAFTSLTGLAADSRTVKLRVKSDAAGTIDWVGGESYACLRVYETQGAS